jgi:hypothetical protein
MGIHSESEGLSRAACLLRGKFKHIEQNWV